MVIIQLLTTYHFFFFFFGWSIKSGNSLTPSKMCPSIQYFKTVILPCVRCILISLMTWWKGPGMMNYCPRRDPAVYIYAYCFYFALPVLDNMIINQRLFLQQHVISSWLWTFQLNWLWTFHFGYGLDYSVTWGKLPTFRFLYTFRPEWWWHSVSVYKNEIHCPFNHFNSAAYRYHRLIKLCAWNKNSILYCS